MATLDEIFESMAFPESGSAHEFLTIDPDTRVITVPSIESVFGVENDGNAETKYFQCPRYVGNGLDLASCFLRINYQNANGHRDGYLVSDTTIEGDYIYFGWELWPQVTQYKGTVQFVLCASLPNSTKTADWHTTLAKGTVLEGMEPDAEAVAAETSDLIAQLVALASAQTDGVNAAGAAQTAAVQEAGASQVAAIQSEGTAQIESVRTEASAQVGAIQTAAAQAEADALAEIEGKKQNTLEDIPEGYAALHETVVSVARETADAIVVMKEGETIAVSDASDRPLYGLRLFGKCTQDGTPSPDNPVEIVAIAAPVVTVTGDAAMDGEEEVIQSFASVHDLYGVPVSSGGSCTDVNGQKWICDEVDLCLGVHIQRVEEASPTVASRYAGVSEIDGSGVFCIDFSGYDVASDALSMLCDKMRFYGPVASDAHALAVLAHGSFAYIHDPTAAGSLCFAVDAVASLEDATAWLAENAPVVLYPVLEPVETALSESELAAFAALHSVKPNTIFENHSGAHMAVEYVADTKQYVDAEKNPTVFILGAYESETALNAAHPIGEPGQSYLVGGNLYIWSVAENKWANAGQIRVVQGPRGPRGYNGVDGLPGKDGADGHTPVKGTDYYTEEDKAAFVNEVLAALPTWEGGSY